MRFNTYIFINNNQIFIDSFISIPLIFLNIVVLKSSYMGIDSGIILFY